MIHKIIGGVIIIIIAGVALGMYLSPDDLAGCGVEKSCPHADAIVVISGGNTDARTDEAVRLYHQGLAGTLVVSGAAADKAGPSNAAVMKQRAISQGVPESVIITEEISQTTKQNAQQVASQNADKQWRSIILVTSGYHMRRALLEFAVQLPNVTIYAHPSHTDWSHVWWLTPWGWLTAASELVKIGLFSIGASR